MILQGMQVKDIGR